MLYFTDSPIHQTGYTLLSNQRNGQNKLNRWGKKPNSTTDATSQYDSHISYAARSYEIDASLIKAVIHAESNFNPFAKSHAGALGLMQLMPATASQYNIDNPYNPRQNILAGSKHLRSLLVRFQQNIDLALAAYNAGANAVKRHKGIPPYPETINYVKKVKRLHLQYKKSI